MSWTRTELVAVSSILTLGLVLRIAFAIVVPSPLESDYLGYWTIANNIHEGRGIAGENGQPTAFLSLGYPLFLSAFFSIFGPTIIVVKAVNVILGVTSVALVYLAARRLFVSWPIPAMAAFMLAVYVEAIIYTSYVAKENLMIFLLLVQLVLVLTVSGRRRNLNAALFGLTTGSMALVGNAALALLPGFVLCVIILDRNAKHTFRYFAVAIFAGGLLIAPMLQRNHNVFGSYSLNNNGGFNLYIGNNPNATPYFTSIIDTPIGPEWKQLHATLGERGTDILLRERAVQHILANPSATLELALRKAVAFWTPPVHAGQYQQGAMETLVRFVWLVEFCIIGSLFLMSATQLRAQTWQVGMLWLLVGGYTAIHMLFYVIYRYRLPIMPVLCIGAALSANLVISKIASGWPARSSRSHAMKQTM